MIWDGILGLAYPNKHLIEKGIDPFFDNIIKQEILTKRGDKNQFSYYLGQEKGAITFGGADVRFKLDLNEEFKWTKVTEKKYWTVQLEKILKIPKNNEKNGKNEKNENVSPTVYCPNGSKAIVDTGTYLIYGPSNIMQVIYFLKKLGLYEKHELGTM